MTSTFFWIDMTWKSAAVSGLALLVVAFLKNRCAADRAAILRLAVLALLSLPLLAHSLPSIGIETWMDVPVQPMPELGLGSPTDGQGLAVPMEQEWVDQIPAALALLYLAGLLMAAIRLLMGLYLLRTWTANAGEVTDERWVQALARAHAALGLRSTPRLLLSRQIPGPLSWGLLRPVVLIDADTFRRADDAGPILHHELAHIARHDWAMLMLSRLVAALFWFNPLVRLLVRELEQRSEEAADVEAARQLGEVEYAELLVIYARSAQRTEVLAHAIAPAAVSLSRRVDAVLEEGKKAPAGWHWRTLAGIVGVSVAVPLAAVEFVPMAREPAPTLPISSVIAAPAPLKAVSRAFSSAGAPQLRPAEIHSPGPVSRTDVSHTRRVATNASASPAPADRPSVGEAKRDIPADMERDADMMDQDADSLAVQAEAFRRQASQDLAVLKHAAALDISVRGMRLSAKGTRSNAEVLRRHQQIERDLHKPPE